jgi:hypothetical protein
MMQNQCLLALLAWPIRRWVVALFTALGTYVVIAIPTDIISNPVFGRDVAVTSWSVPVLLVTSVLSGLLVATYIKTPAIDYANKSARAGGIGGFMAYLAVGCPVCNKLALLALGYTGALQYFAPIQPYLAAAGLALLFYALRQRLLNENSCALPTR